MNQEERIAQLESKLRQLEEKFNKGRFSNQIVFDSPVKFNRGIIAGSEGLSIVESGQKVGFFGVTPVTRQASIGQPSGGATVDSQARAAINSILTVLDNYGLTL